MIRAAIRLLSMLPRALDIAHLEWGLRELQSWNPCHPDVPRIVRRISELRGMR